MTARTDVHREGALAKVNPRSLGVTWTERAAIALFVGLSWAPHKRRRSAGRPSWQLLWGTCSSEAPLPPSCSSRTGWQNRRRHRPPLHSRRSLTAALQPPRPPRPPRRCIRRRRAQRQRHEAPQNPRGPHRAQLVLRRCWTSGGQIGDGTCSSACARSGACALGCSTGSTRTPRTAGQRTSSSATRQEDFAVTRRRDTAQRALFNEEGESRDNHPHVVVIQDLAIQYGFNRMRAKTTSLGDACEVLSWNHFR